MRKPWEHEGSVWKTEASYWSWLRGHIRKIWMHYPVAKNFKNSKCRPVTPEEKLRLGLHPSTKLIGQCSICKQWFPKSKLEIDHIQASEGCKSYDTAHSFLDHNAMVSPEELQLICKETCHPIKSYADKEGCSFEEARLQKKKIAFFKQDLGIVKRKLFTMGAKEEDLKNDKTRKAFYNKHRGIK